jgi:hypothetical protein
MIMGTLCKANYYFDTHIRRWIGLLLAFCFFMGIVAFAMHHHNTYFLLKDCTICKAKTSLVGTLNKIIADLALAVTIDNHGSKEIHLTLSCLTYTHQRPFITSLLPNSSLNKAPPFLS